MDTLDQDVVNLAKAIRQKESGNRAVIPAEGSKLGGASRYQYTHNTWKETARKYLGNENTPLSLQNENKATYLKIKDWKDKGYNPAQIASMWNAGEGRPDAYKQNWKGTNKYGVAYDTPKYVASVYDEYQKIKGSNPQSRQSRQPAQPVVPTVAEQRQTLQAQGQPVARNPERVEPTLGGKIARDVLKTPARFLENIKAIPKLIKGQSYEDATSSESKYFGGTIQGVGTKGGPTTTQNLGSQLKDTGGSALEMASYIPVAGAVGGTAKLLKQSVKLSAKQLATQTAKRLGLNVIEGAVGNTLFEGGKKLQGEADRESLGKSALYGGAGGLAFGVGGRALSGVFRGARKTAVALGKGGVPEDLAEEATGKLKGAWDEYIEDFKDLTSFRDKYKQKTGANIADILTREVITPEIKGNKIDLTDSIAKNETKIASSAENVKGLAQAFNDVPVRLIDLERTATDVVNNTDSILSSGNINKARKGVQQLFEGLREAYGETINPEIANDIRVAMNRQTKAFTGSVGEMFEQDIANAVGDAVRTKLDEVIQDDVFRRANAEIGELLNVRKFMQKVNGKNIGGGRFSQAFAGIVGSKILGGANNLPMGFGDIIGYVGGKQLQKQANQYAFGKAGPRTRAILRRLENKSAIGAEVAEKTNNRKQVLLPARTSTVNKAFGSGKTINLPPKAQSTIDAQEMATQSLQKIKKGDFIEVKGEEVEVTLKTDDGIVVKDGNGKREFISKENFAKGQGEQAFGAVAGLEKDEDGNLKFNKDKALMGVAGMAVAKKAGLMKGAKDVGENLIQEANKTSDIWYHGTTPENKASILKNGINTKLNTKGFAEQPEAFYVGDKTEASMYGKNTVGIKIKTGENPNILNISSKEWADIAGKSTNSKETEIALKELRSRGYDAINHGDELEILNTKKFEVFDPEVKKISKPTNLPKPYAGEKDLTTKILKDLEGKTTVSKQYILDATNRGELKQVERDLIRGLVENEGKEINVNEFAKKVKAELLPLKVNKAAKPPRNTYANGQMTRDVSIGRFENVALPDDLRGSIKNYDEHVYESPVATSAGEVHWRRGEHPNYFGHTRVEDMADNNTRRVIEVQSDLYQKGNLERELTKGTVPYTNPSQVPVQQMRNNGYTEAQIKQILKDAKDGSASILAENKKRVSKLQQYNDPTAHFRMIREEIKKASEDGKTKLQFPTGETAMKIEGLGETSNWRISRDGRPTSLNQNDLKVGQEIFDSNVGQADWIITDVLGDGKFKAVPKEQLEIDRAWGYLSDDGNYMAVNSITDDVTEFSTSSDAKTWIKNRRNGTNAEQFDISGKIDTSNPIYKFYEKEVQKYLSKFGGTKVVDDKGVSWIEVPIKKEWAKMPVEAFAFAPLAFLKKDKTEESKTKKSGLFSNKTTYIAPKENPLLKEKQPLTDEKLGKALMQLESSGGKNKKNEDPGEMKWLVGLTETAINELKRLKRIKENFNKNNREDVIKAGIEYFKLMQERNPKMTPAEVYVDKYWTQWKKLPNPQTARAKKMAEFQNLISVENS